MPQKKNKGFFKKILLIGGVMFSTLFNKTRHFERESGEYGIPTAHSLSTTPVVHADVTDSACFSGNIFVAVILDSRKRFIGKPIKTFKETDAVLGIVVDEGARASSLQKFTLMSGRVQKTHHIYEGYRKFIKICSQGGTFISSTSSHPFFTQENGLIKCVDAGSFSPQMPLLECRNGNISWSQTKSVYSWHSFEPVYHLSTTTQNFFVSEDGINYILVHNK